jgi:hypothetical protein
MLQCDCEAGITKACALETIHTICDSNHDLLQAIHHELTSSSADWEGMHIKGHQDTDTPFDKLDRSSQLNVLVDKMAKSFLIETQSLPTHSTVWSRAWYITVHTIPLVTQINQTLYDLVHEKEAKAYLIKKNRITEPIFNYVHWTRLGKALDNMSLPRRLFCSKHTVGMCGVRKFQKLWKTSETDFCPHCGQPEDALHVWQC